MITELRLENWKSFGEATLYIDPLSILIGTNASGKSNVLDALQFLHLVSLGESFTNAVRGIRGSFDWMEKKGCDFFDIKVVISQSIDKYTYHLRCSVKEDDCFSLLEEIFSQNDCVYSSVEKQDKSVLSLFAFAGMISNLRPELEEEYEVLYTIGRFSREIENELKKIFILSVIPKSMTAYSSLSDNLEFDSSNIAGVLAALPSDKQKEVEDTITYYASRLPERDIHRVYAEKVGKLGKDAMLYCDEKWGESGEIFTVDARAMSDGTLRFLAILTALLTLPEGSLLAIDEVDNGFHPSRAHLLLEALQTIGKQRNIDVLVTTHNPALLDALGTEFVPFVTVAHRDSITGESKLTLLEDIEQLPKLLAQGTVGKLSTQGLIEKSLESVHG